MLRHIRHISSKPIRWPKPLLPVKRKQLVGGGPFALVDRTALIGRDPSDPRRRALP